MQHAVLIVISLAANSDMEGKFLCYIGVVEKTGSIIILRYEKTGAPSKRQMIERSSD